MTEQEGEPERWYEASDPDDFQQLLISCPEYFERLAVSGRVR
jgi:hypothetical protein